MIASSTEYKSNIIQRMGGEQDFQFVVLSLVDRLQDDRNLERFFSRSAVNKNKLAAHQDKFLRGIFEQKQARDVDRRTRARYNSLMAQGFNELHFDLVVSHFVEALEDAWVHDQEVIGDAVTILKSVRHIFENKDCKSHGPVARTALPGVSAC